MIQIETVRSPVLYSPRQLHTAALLAAFLDAGRFVLCEKPKP